MTAVSEHGKQSWPARNMRQILVMEGEEVSLRAVGREGASVKRVQFREGDSELGAATHNKEAWTMSCKPKALGAHGLYAVYELADGSRGVTRPGLVVVTKLRPEGDGR